MDDPIKYWENLSKSIKEHRFRSNVETWISSLEKDKAHHLKDKAHHQEKVIHLLKEKAHHQENVIHLRKEKAHLQEAFLVAIELEREKRASDQGQFTFLLSLLFSSVLSHRSIRPLPPSPSPTPHCVSNSLTYSVSLIHLHTLSSFIFPILLILSNPAHTFSYPNKFLYVFYFTYLFFVYPFLMDFSTLWPFSHSPTYFNCWCSSAHRRNTVNKEINFRG